MKFGRGFVERIAKAGKVVAGAAMQHKGLLAKGIELHPAAKLVMSMRDITPEDRVNVAGDMTAQLVSEEQEKK